MHPYFAKNSTFDTNTWVETSFANLIGSMEPIETILTEPLKNPRVANPRELNPQQERIPCITKLIAPTVKT